MVLSGRLQEVDAGNSGHRQVGDDRVEFPPVQEFKRLFPARTTLAIEFFASQSLHEQPAYFRVVIDHQDSSLGVSTHVLVEGNPNSTAAFTDEKHLFRVRCGLLPDVLLAYKLLQYAS